MKAKKRKCSTQVLMNFSRFVKCRGINFTQPVHRDKPPQMGYQYLWGSKHLNLSYSTIYGQYNGINNE